MEKYSCCLYNLKTGCGKIRDFLFKSMFKKSGRLWEIIENYDVEIVEFGGKLS